MCCLELQLRIADRKSGRRQEVSMWKSCTAEVVNTRKHTNAFIYCKLGEFALLQQQTQCGREAKSAKSEVKLKETFLQTPRMAVKQCLTCLQSAAAAEVS